MIKLNHDGNMFFLYIYIYIYHIYIDVDSKGTGLLMVPFVFFQKHSLADVLDKQASVCVCSVGLEAPVVAGCGFAPRDDEATQLLGPQCHQVRDVSLNPKP